MGKTLYVASELTSHWHSTWCALCVSVCAQWQLTLPQTQHTRISGWGQDGVDLGPHSEKAAICSHMRQPPTDPPQRVLSSQAPIHMTCPPTNVSWLPHQHVLAAPPHVLGMWQYFVRLRTWRG